LGPRRWLGHPQKAKKKKKKKRKKKKEKGFWLLGVAPWVAGATPKPKLVASHTLGGRGWFGHPCILSFFFLSFFFFFFFSFVFLFCFF
jgi:hypothetical protein